MTLFVHTITMFAVLRVNKTTIATQKASAVLSSHQYSSEQRLKYWCYQPCFCLCLGFSQIIMMAPFLLMILHFSQMGFTEDLTFISKYTPFLKKSPYTIVTERFANCKHYFKENARFLRVFCAILISWRSACGTLAPSAVAEGNIFLSHECASCPKGILLYGKSRRNFP